MNLSTQRLRRSLEMADPVDLFLILMAIGTGCYVLGWIAGIFP